MSIQEQLKEVVEGNDVVLFMKGSPDFPQCGFSGLATQILQQTGTKFASVMYWQTMLSVKALKPIQIGRPFRSFISKANLSGVQTLSRNCLRTVNCRNS